MIPHQTPFFLPWLYPTLTWRMPQDDHALYLTFDDGPVSGPTDFALEQLARAGIPATFFCIGDNIRKYPALLRRILAAGHEVGNHTCNHLNGWSTRTQAYVENAAGFESALQEVSPALSSRLFRPPYGRITRRQIRSLGHYRIIMWDVLSRDYNRELSPDQCLRGTLRACRPGSIIVFHDSYKSEKNMAYALPRLIDDCIGKGYKFKAI